jgi:diadenylate cyclase
MKFGFEIFRVGFLRVTVFDVLDILLIAFILYKLYLFIRGSRAAQMTVGLVVILGVSLVARVFQMNAATWIFDSLQTVWLIAFVIIFQPELRRMLLHLGQSRVIRFFVPIASTRFVDEVVKASLELSKRGYGGLIVMPRESGIKSVVETGTKLQAEVSSPLIVSIFNPRSPLHDGAVVIQNDLIEAAKCILPLSQDPNIDVAIGTRHRAALGLSEESDCVVVVVSEETGQISVAIDGKLIRNLDDESVRAILQDSFKIAPAG